jgi:hypothetical protein
MSAVIINDEVRAAIKEAMTKAREHVLPIAEAKRIALPDLDVVQLADRTIKTEPRSECIHIPVGFMACISFEEQPIGLCKHLSISAPHPGRIPNQYAVSMIAEEFGMLLDGSKPTKTWLEEIAPNHHAVNVVELD